MPEKGIRSTYSQCPFELLMQDQKGTIASGSGFFFEVDDQWFAITNWHNVSGRHFLNHKPLSNCNRFPTHLTVKLCSYEVGSRSEGTFGIAPHNVPLYDGEQPLWFEHPQLGPMCDVVALPMDRPESCPKFMHNAANKIGKIKIPIKPGCNVFVVGFPHAISVGFGLPIWKSGYIASEPYYDVTLEGEQWEYGGLLGGKKLPAFFIDAQTRPGMSGSPVFARFYGSWDMSDPYRSIDFDEPELWDRDDVVLGGEGTEFVGCYSARIMSKENEAGLGLCWRRDVIEKVCRGNQSGNNPHFSMT